MCVLYLLEAGTRASRSGGRIIIETCDGEKRSVPMDAVTGVVVGKRAQITTQAIFTFLERGAAVSYVDFRGRVCGQISARTARATELHAQSACLGDAARCALIAAQIVREKIVAQRKLLAYYAKRDDGTNVSDTVARLIALEKKADPHIGVDELRGVEGTAAQNYFDAVGCIVQKLGWTWWGRSCRPAADAANALLNYGYAFLERDVRVAVAGAGLDARFGFLHSNNDRKDSLVYDLMEKYRPGIVDRLILKLMHLRVISEDQIPLTEVGCLLTDEARKKWCVSYESFMEEKSAGCGGKSRRQILRDDIYEFAQDLRDDRQIAS